MPGQTYTLDLEWENNVEFKMTSQKNSDPKITVILSEENEHYSANRDSIEAICKGFFALVLKKIGDEMVS